MILTLALLMATVAHGCFALAMPRHWREASRRASQKPPHPQMLRMIGVAAFGACLASCIWHSGVGFGIVLWMLLVSVAAFLIAFLLSWRGGDVEE